MMETDWNKAKALLEDLYNASSELERMFKRKFTLDGHLVGSVGEVVAAYMFDFDLNAASTTGHDARTQDGRQVEIKLTQGTSVAFRHEPEHAIVLYRPRKGPVEVVYNGPGYPVWEAAGEMQKNGQRGISVSSLKKLFKNVPENKRLLVIREAPI